jgi:hypothetical protein
LHSFLPLASRRVFKAAARSLSTSQSSSAAAVNPPPKPLARTVRSSGKDDHAARAAERAETPASHGQVPRWQVKREEDLMRDDVCSLPSFSRFSHVVPDRMEDIVEGI